MNYQMSLNLQIKNNGFEINVALSIYGVNIYNEFSRKDGEKKKIKVFYLLSYPSLYIS